MASAWLAFSAYLNEHVSDMDRNVRLVLANGYLNFPQALSRAALTMALSFHYCGDAARSKRYYDLCHRAATTCGDETEISALMHDRAAMSIHEMRVAAFRSLEKDGAASTGTTNLQSVISYEELVGIRSLPSLSPQLAAYEFVLKGKWAEAMDAINLSLDSARRDGFSRLVPGLLADRALSQIMLNRVADAHEDIVASLREAETVGLHRDDRALFFSRLAQTYRLIGKDSNAAQCSLIAQLAWEQVREFQESLLKVVLALDDEFLR